MRILAALLLLGSVALADSSVPNAGGASAPVVSLERTACYGRCPIYKVTVLRDGTVLWEGERFVKTVGKATAKLPPAALAQLADAFKTADFFALHDKYESYDVTDHPSAVTTFDDGKRKKTVRHYHGDRSAPKAVYELEDAVDRIVGTAKWIGREQR
jgi:uncharacterized protein DUF6438